MLYLIHAVVGAIIGNNFSSVGIIFLLAVILHFLLDIIPHWDGFYDKVLFHLNGEIKINKKMFIFELIDGLLSFLFVAIFYIGFKNPLIFLGAFFSLLPDILKTTYFIKIKKKRPFLFYAKFHSKIQKEINWKPGLLIQEILLIILLYLFF